MIENTAARDPLIHLIGLMGEGNDEYIGGMEAAGQRQLVAAQVLPAELRGQEAELTALGFVLGEPVEGDRLFRNATLPPGWSKQGSDHNMWSYVVDEMGRRRLSIFYKAAYYDRDAFARLETVQSYVAAVAHGETELIFDAEWATPSEVAMQASASDDYYEEQANECDGRADAGAGDVAYWRGRAVEHRTSAAKFRAIAARAVGER